MSFAEFMTLGYHTILLNFDVISLRLRKNKKSLFQRDRASNYTPEIFYVKLINYTIGIIYTILNLG